MVAGIVLSLANGRSPGDAVRFGVAAGASAVMTPGTELCRREDTERLYQQIIVKEQEALNGKYWSYPFKKGLEVFNQDKLITDDKARLQIKQDGLILVEGFFDAAKLVEAGCLNVAALMGAQISEMQLARLKYIDAQVNIPKITLFLDRDAAGTAGARKTHLILQGNGFKTEIFNWDQVFISSKGSPIVIPKKIKDPCDMTSIQIKWLRKKGFSKGLKKVKG